MAPSTSARETCLLTRNLVEEQFFVIIALSCDKSALLLVITDGFPRHVRNLDLVELAEAQHLVNENIVEV